MIDLSIGDGVGFSAAGLVLATFCMRSMSALRWVAIASNVAFMAYAYLEGLAPVLLLHALLLPVNIWRLAQLRGARGRSEPNEQRSSGGATPNEPRDFDCLQFEALASKRGRYRHARGTSPTRRGTGYGRQAGCGRLDTADRYATSRSVPGPGPTRGQFQF